MKKISAVLLILDISVSCIKPPENIKLRYFLKQDASYVYTVKSTLRIKVENPIVSINESINFKGKILLRVQNSTKNGIQVSAKIISLNYQSTNPFIDEYIKRMMKLVEKKFEKFYISPTGELKVPLVFRHKGQIDKGFSKTMNIVIPIFPDRGVCDGFEWHKKMEISGKSLGNWVFSRVKQKFTVREIWDTYATISDSFKLNVYKANGPKKPKDLIKIGETTGTGKMKFDYINGEVLERELNIAFYQNTEIKYKTLKLPIKLKGKLILSVEILNESI